MKIEQECFQEAQWVGENILLDLPGKWENSFVINNNGAAVIGYLVASLLKVEHIHIYRVAILPGYSNKGYGRILLRQAVQHYVFKGIKYITVEVCDRFPVDSFYLNNGFKLLKGTELIKYLKLRNRLNDKDEYLKNKSRVYKYSKGT